jgi:choline monooxygenase
VATPVRNVVCPLHRWTYELDGKLIGAPHFADDPCLNLRNYPLQNWHGLLFEGGRRDVAADLAAWARGRTSTSTGYVFDRAELHPCDYNWKTFIEVYLEDYHVAPFHPGLGAFVTCEDLRWEFGAEHSVQTVGVHAALAEAGLPHLPPLARGGAQVPPRPPAAHGAIWLTYYPTVMVEWYPHVLVVSSLFPRGRARR